MYIAYFDESGDDGIINSSSEFFILTSVYMHFQSWKSNFERIHSFRKQIKETYGLPIYLEMKGKDLLLNKRPIRSFNLSQERRMEILDQLVSCITTLNLSCINVIINKSKITGFEYDILDNALNYNIQRIENDISNMGPEHRFLIISDEGRVGKMRKTTRRIQRINWIPSKFSTSSYRKEIEKLIEDPLPKDSKDSYFIQIADLISWLAFLYSKRMIVNSRWANRLENLLTFSQIQNWLNLLKDNNILNIRASNDNEYGFVIYPK
jgi:hypothetical protein